MTPETTSRADAGTMWLRRAPATRHALRWIAGAAASALALFICFAHLSSLNINGDEYIYVNAGWDYVHGDFSANQEHPPTAKYLFGLAQLAGGRGIAAPRILVGCLVILGAVVMFVWLRREVGTGAGILAAGLWLLTPRQIDGYRIDRVALLEPVMMFFALVAMWLIWRWARRQSGMWAVAAAGAATALSITAKVSTAAILPSFILLIALTQRNRRGIAGAGLFTLVAAGVAAAVYAGPGSTAFGYLIEFQTGHNQGGHLVWIAGASYTVSPWWANAWYFGVGVGTATAFALVAGSVIALVRKPDLLVIFLATGLVGFLVFYFVVARVALSFYYYAFVPFLTMLAAIGCARLWGRAGPRARAVRRSIALLIIASAAIGVVQITKATQDIHVSGIAAVAEVLQERPPIDGKVLVLSMTPNKYLPYLGATGTQDQADGPFSAVVVGDDPRFPPDAAVTDALMSRPDLFRSEVHDGVRVWISSTPVLYRGAAFVPST